MPILQPTDSNRKFQLITGEAFSGGTWEQELDHMVARVRDLVSIGDPGQILVVCMSFMARCTELALALVRVEEDNRKARHFRTSQLQRVMDLLDFEFRGASRMVELKRQELDATR